MTTDDLKMGAEPTAETSCVSDIPHTVEVAIRCQQPNIVQFSLRNFINFICI
jgi:hypothetical protein